MARSQQFEVSVRVKGGFPVLVRGTIQPAEHDVGIMSSYIDSYELFTLKGKPCPWLRLSPSEEDRLIERVWDELCAQAYDS